VALHDTAGDGETEPGAAGAAAAVRLEAKERPRDVVACFLGDPRAVVLDREPRMTLVHGHLENDPARRIADRVPQQVLDGPLEEPAVGEDGGFSGNDELDLDGAVFRHVQSGELCKVGEPLGRVEVLARERGVVGLDVAEQLRHEVVQGVELRNATVYAPSSGTVLSVFVRNGERAPSGTLLTLADLARMEAKIEVYQEAVPRLSVGQPVRLESLVLEAPLTGSIRRIGLEVGRQSLTGSDPAANTDARVVKAWVDIDQDSTAQAARFVGLEVVAHVEVEDAE